MDFLEALFEGGAITWEQFKAGVEKAGYKIADLSTGNYVAKKKYEDELKAKDDTIKDLNTQISTRDTDLATIKSDLEKAKNSGADSQTTIDTLNTQLSKLQGEYDKAKSDYEAKLAGQQYEFAVTEFANGLQFTSRAAKEQFKNEMISAGLKMKDKSIIGANDFLTSYKETNADSFKVEEPDPAPAPEGGNPDPNLGKPFFIKPTAPTPDPNSNPFDGIFNFSGVR